MKLEIESIDDVSGSLSPSYSFFHCTLTVEGVWWEEEAEVRQWISATFGPRGDENVETLSDDEIGGAGDSGFLRFRAKLPAASEDDLRRKVGDIVPLARVA